MTQEQADAYGLVMLILTAFEGAKVSPRHRRMLRDAAAGAWPASRGRAGKRPIDVTPVIVQALGIVGELAPELQRAGNAAARAHAVVFLMRLGETIGEYDLQVSAHREIDHVLELFAKYTDKKPRKGQLSASGVLARIAIRLEILGYTRRSDLASAVQAIDKARAR